MKFRLKEHVIKADAISPVEDYLRSLGINKPESFINRPSPEDEEPWENIHNIDKGLEMLKKHLDNDSSIFLQVDSDTDGYTSAAIFYGFIKTIAPYADIDFNIHPEKEHGIVLEDVGYHYDLVVIPDAGSNQKEDLEELEKRADVLIIDHHIADVDVNSDKVIVINNQTSPNFKNKSSSGAGMVYKFIKGYCETYDLGLVYEDFIDLAAVGIIADSMDSRNLDNNYIIYHGLKNVNNPMLKALLQYRSYSVSDVDNPNKIDIAFYVAPIINGLIRFGDMESKRDFFYGLANPFINEEFERVWRGEVKIENYYEKTAREAANIKTKQDTAVKKLLPILQDRIESNNLDKNQIIVCKTSKSNPDEVPKTVTGLVAMKLSVIYNKPVLVVRPVFTTDKTIYAGSGRASAADGFDSFKNFLDGSGMTNYAAGHDMAFGASVDEDTIPELIEYANEELEEIDFGSATVEVDGHFEFGIPKDLLLDFAKVSHIYGNGIPQPKFVFDIMISPSDFSAIGKDKRTLRIQSQGITMIEFWAEDNIKYLEENFKETGMLRVIGRPELNVYNGYTSVQVHIDSLEKLEGGAELF